MSKGSGASIERPLADVRVIDLTAFGAGPIATMALADLGADVIKIEHPSGDPSRLMGTKFANGWGSLFVSVNRNKKFVAIDYKTEAGRELIRRLLADADVMVENSRAGLWESYGLGYEDVSADNPQIIYGSLTGFGTEGPMRDWLGLDPVAQAVGGLIAITGTESSPAKIGAAVCDVMAGRLLASGIVTALYARFRFGRGQRVETTLLDAALALLVSRETEYQTSGVVPQRVGTGHLTAVPTHAYRTKDGRYVMLTVYGDAHFKRLCETAGRPHLVDDQRFATADQRAKHAAECIAAVQEFMELRNESEWTELLSGVIPYGPIMEFDQLFDHDQLRVNESLVRFDLPGAGDAFTVGSSIRYSATKVSDVVAVPNRVGADTFEVLSRCGFADDEIKALSDAGTIVI